MVFLLVGPHRLARDERNRRTTHFPAVTTWHGTPQAAPWCKENMMKVEKRCGLFFNRASSHRAYPRAIAGDRRGAVGETWFSELAGFSRGE